MKDYRLTKLTEAIMKQTRLNPTEARALALEVYGSIDFNDKRSFHERVQPILKQRNLLRK